MGAAKIRTIVYIDGFNLYYSCLKRTPYKWLDVCAFSRAVLQNTTCNLIAVKYFTARVSENPRDPEQRRRQNIYLLALATLDDCQMTEGQYRSHVKTNEVAPPDRKHLPKHVRPLAPWLSPQELNNSVWETAAGWGIGAGPSIDIVNHEEKGSDVNMAVHMLNDAWAGEMDCAVLVSNDSDLAEACRLVRERGVQLGLVTKPRRPTGALSMHANFHRRIMAGHLRGAQLPEVVTRSNGQELSKPEGW